MSSPSPSPVDLPADLRERIPETGIALLITRQNLSLADRLQRERGGVSWTVLAKGELVGRGARWLLGRLRSRPWDLVLLEDEAPEAERRLDLYCLMLLAARARRRVLVWGTPPRVRTVGWGVEGPRLLGSAIREKLAVLRAGLEAAWMLLWIRPRPPRPIPRGRSLVYLRTDFGFGIRAGGSVTHVGGFLRGARDLGYETTVVTTDPLAHLPSETTEILVPPPSFPRFVEEAALVAYNRVMTGAATRALRSSPPDVIVHRHSVFSLAGVLLARALDRPLVLEVNSSEVWVRRNWSRLLFPGWARSLELRAFACADRITVVSRVLGRQIEELGVDPAKIVVNPNGVDVSRFDPGAVGGGTRTSLGFGAESIVVGFLGTFTRWHGVLFLAEQVAPLLEAEPRLGFMFLGDGDLRAAAAGRVNADGAAGACRFTGLVPPEEIPDYLAACDILVSPHLPFEDGTEFFGSPTKLFEYLASGRAVVAARLGQIGEVIRDHKNGLLFPPGDGEAFRTAVLALAHDRAFREELGRAGRAVVEGEYTWRENARRALSPARVATSPGGQAE